MRDELMSEIIKLEWDMFSHVSNVGGPASCQMRPDTFKIMRKSQAATWSDELLASYLEDLKTATREGRNIMTEKYARMMESTFPEEYRKLAASLPPVDKETLQKIEEIVAINVGWKAELFDRYPRLSGKGRPLRTSEDSAMETSFETYLRGELKTYSARTITLLHELTLRQQQDGVNGAALNLLNQVQQYRVCHARTGRRPSRGSLTAFPASLRARLYLSLALSGMACLQKGKPARKANSRDPKAPGP